MLRINGEPGTCDCGNNGTGQDKPRLMAVISGLVSYQSDKAGAKKAAENDRFRGWSVVRASLVRTGPELKRYQLDSTQKTRGKKKRAYFDETSKDLF